MKKITISTLILSLIAAFWSGCEKKEDASSLVSTKSLTKNITLKGVDGTNLTLIDTGSGFKVSELKGKTTLVVFFATWCPPCKAEIPHLIALQDKYKNDFAVVAILGEKNKPNEELNAFIKDHNINYFVANSETNMEAMQIFGVRGFPTMFMFDRDGKKIAYYPGATPQEVIEQDILKSLGKK